MLVRSVKTALKFIMRGQYPNNEVLRTILVRVEYIINCRPLIHVSVDPSYPGSLATNHIPMESFKFTLVVIQFIKKTVVTSKVFAGQLLEENICLA